MIRSLAEQLLARLTVRRRLGAPDGGGELIASSGAGGLKFLFRASDNLDPPLLAIARRIVKPNAIVWDVGANVGLFSVAAAGLAGAGGSVLAIEADLDVARLLMRTASLRANRSLAPISVLPVAVSSAAGVSSFSIAKRARASNALTGFGNSQMGGVRTTRMAPTLSLDDLRRNLPAPDIVKIDVEGAESAVLAGARGLLRRDRPVVFCEVGAARAASVTAELRDAEYLIFDGQSVVRNERCSAVATACWDTVAVPAEKAHDQGWLD